MLLKKRLLSFRFSKNFFYNKYKFKKSGYKNFKQDSHNYCPVCGCHSGTLISEVDRVGVQCDTVVCDLCDLVFNNSYISNPVEFYGQEWGADRWDNPEESFLRRTSSDSYSWKRMAFVAGILGEEFKKIQLVLEVGCGDGCNLFPYHLCGKEVIGFDFNPVYLAPGRERGMNLVEGVVQDSEESADLALLVHSFEHMIDLDSSIKDVSKSLRVGGYVYVEVPGIRNWNQPLSTRKSEMGLQSSTNFLTYLQCEHNYHFELSHIKHLWERNGFEMVAGDEWVRCVFKKTGEFNNSSLESLVRGGVGIDDHLRNVERSFFSIGNLFFMFCRFWGKS